MTKIHKIVLTGGPSGGKTTLQRAIFEQIPEAYCAPEVATVLLSGGFPAPTELHPWEEAWQRNFQLAVAAGQVALENITNQRAQQEGKLLAIYDRGLLDGASYLPGGIRELEEITGHDEHSMLSNYDSVLHLTTTAAHAAYDKQSNPHRFEESAAALELDQRIMTAWENHPNRIILDEPDKAERIAKGLLAVRTLLEGGAK
jgi:predicted ATPase